MLRLAALLSTLLAFAPALTAQPGADSALVARLYDDLARGDIPAVVAALDDHVFWTEGAHSPQAGRYVGPGTVAAHVLLPEVTTRRGAGVLDRLSLDGDRVVAVGTTGRVDPATGQPTAVRFRHVWQVLDGRVVSVHRADDDSDLSAADLCGAEPC